MTMAEFSTQKIPRKRGKGVVIITLDDGYADNYSIAFPILKRYGFAGTIFLASDYVGTDHIYWWDAPKISTEGDRSLYQILTWEQVREMECYGFEAGSHSCTHPRLTHVSTEQRWDEIKRSRTDLERKLGHDVVSFCYPHGDLNKQVTRMVEKAGYRSAVVTPPRTGIPLSPFALRRVGIYHHTTQLLFRVKTNLYVRKVYRRISGRRIFDRIMSKGPRW